MTVRYPPSFYAYVRSELNVRYKVGPPEDNTGNIKTLGLLMAEESNTYQFCVH